MLREDAEPHTSYFHHDGMHCSNRDILKHTAGIHKRHIGTVYSSHDVDLEALAGRSLMIDGSKDDDEVLATHASRSSSGNAVL